MRAPGMDRVARAFRALERVARTDVDEARRFLLAYVVDHYMKLTDDEAEELKALSQSSTATEVKQMFLSFQSRAHEQGLSQGLSAGRAHGEQAVLLRLMRRRFGALAPEVVARVEAIQDTNQLEALADRILDARTLDELGLPTA
jgi:flagellar biosynthesis/type III secretory pathway protein FliH